MYGLPADGAAHVESKGCSLKNRKLPRIFQVGAHSEVPPCPSPAGCLQWNIISKIAGNAMLKHSFLPPNLVVFSLLPRRGL